MMMVLGAVPQVPENYLNVKMIIEQLNLEAIEFTLSVDIKMHKVFIYLITIYSVIDYMK